MNGRTRRRTLARVMVAAIAVAAMFVLASGVADAAPPIILTADQVSLHPTATWSLPPGVTSQVVEVATNPAVGSDGYFFSENRKDFDLLSDTQANWTATDPLTPGTYYIHIIGYDEACFFANLCPVRESSQTLTLVIPVPMVALATVADGQGTITSAPTGILCASGTCSASFPSGTVATLQAAPADGWYFNGWTGGLCDAVTLPTCTTTLSAPQTVVSAHFLPRQAVTLGLKPLSYACLRHVSVSGLSIAPQMGHPVDGTLTLRIHSTKITRSVNLKNAYGLWTFTSFKKLKPGLYSVSASYSGDTWRTPATRTKSIRLKKC